MSEREDAAITLANLLRCNMRAVKDDGALANVPVSSEWQNAEALRGYDGQVTVGLAESADEKIEFSGKTRRRLQFLRVNVWTTDSHSMTETGRVMRRKIVEEVLRVIRQNRSKPNETIYNFFNTGAGKETRKAYLSNVGAPPGGQEWTEFSDANYAKLWYSDDDRCQISYSQVGKHAAMLFGFRLDSRERAVQRIVLVFEGYGTAPGGNGVAVKIWNHVAGNWDHAQTGGAGGTDENISLTVTSDLPDHVDDDGFVWFLALTLNTSDGETAATLSCDYVACTVTVNGITYCDTLSYRDLDRVDVKPFMYRTEITVKSWFFENTG